MSNGFNATLLIAALGASFACDSKPPPASTAPAAIVVGKAPSQSTGETKAIKVGEATTRQTFDESLSAKVVNQGKVVSGSQVVGGAADSGTK